MRLGSALIAIMAALAPFPSFGQTATGTGTANSVSGSNENIIAPTFSFNSTSAPVVPMAAPVPLLQPQIFGTLQRTPSGASVGMTAGYMNGCRLSFSRSTRPEVKYAEGKSEKTRLSFFANPNYRALAHGSSVEIEEVTPSFSADPVPNAVCLGSIGIRTVDGSTDFDAVVADAVDYVFENLHGIRKVHMLFFPAGIAVASGVSSSGSSFGIGSGISHFFSAFTAGAITPSASTGNGHARPEEYIGGTLILLGILEQGGSTIAPNDFTSHYRAPAPQAGQGNNGKKAEAAK